jgi:membrane AbrB-like protein
MNVSLSRSLGAPALCALAAAGGAVAMKLHVPLPWLIGPMFTIALWSVMGLGFWLPPWSRKLGQLVVAASVGLSFEKAGVGSVVQHGFAILCVSVLTILASGVAALVFKRVARVDRMTAALACIPAGPTEMARVSEQLGVDPSPVAFAQTLRIASIAVFVPPLLILLETLPFTPATSLSTPALDLFGCALLLAGSAAAGMLLLVIGAPNPFFLGPLAFAAASTVVDFPVSALPRPGLLAGQVLLGMWLGATFTRQFFSKSRVLLIGAATSTVVLLLLCGAVAIGVATWSGLPLKTMLLACAPGGVTEMSLTAEVVHADVAIVAAFHICRIFVVMIAAPVLLRLVNRGL